MRSIVVPLPEPVHAALISRAVAEFRTPKEQAQKAIVEHLRVSGALTPDGRQEAADARA